MDHLLRKYLVPLFAPPDDAGAGDPPADPPVADVVAGDPPAPGAEPPAGRAGELDCWYDEDKRIIYVCLLSFRNALMELGEDGGDSNAEAYYVARRQVIDPF